MPLSSTPSYLPRPSRLMSHFMRAALLGILTVGAGCAAQKKAAPCQPLDAMQGLCELPENDAPEAAPGPVAPAPHTGRPLPTVVPPSVSAPAPQPEPEAVVEQTVVPTESGVMTGVPARSSASAPLNTQGSAPARTSASAPLNTQGSAPARTSGHAPAQTQSVAPAQTQAAIAPAPAKAALTKEQRVAETVKDLDGLTFKGEFADIPKELAKDRGARDTAFGKAKMELVEILGILLDTTVREMDIPDEWLDDGATYSFHDTGGGKITIICHLAPSEATLTRIVTAVLDKAASVDTAGGPATEGAPSAAAAEPAIAPQEDLTGIPMPEKMLPGLRLPVQHLDPSLPDDEIYIPNADFRRLVTEACGGKSVALLGVFVEAIPAEEPEGRTTTGSPDRGEKARVDIQWSRALYTAGGKVAWVALLPKDTLVGLQPSGDPRGVTSGIGKQGKVYYTIAALCMERNDAAGAATP